MLTLIAESKTMSVAEERISPELFSCHTPAGEKEADEIMEALAKMPVVELARCTGMTASLAAKMQKMIYEFANKSLGYPAIKAYTGVVFKALDYAGLDTDAKNRCNEGVRLISSLYGFLEPEDIIKPYRLDFNSKAAPGGEAMWAFWRSKVTIQLVRTLQNRGEHELLNLLPADAAKCIDWKLVKRFTKVWKADFQEVLDGGGSKTPSASKLKTMRGLLLRQILAESISDIATLMHCASDSYVCEGTPVYPDHLQFLC